MEEAMIESRIKYLAKYNGLQNVSNLVIEECSELIKELTKLNRKIGSPESIKEEICDVIITIKQLIHCLDIPDADLEKEMRKKIDRTLIRIGGVNDRN